MKRSKFSEAQVAFILRQAEEGASIGEVCRKAGISEATFYVWRKKYGGLLPSEMRRATWPARRLEGGKFWLKPVQGWGQGQQGPDSSSAWRKNSGAGQTHIAPRQTRFYSASVVMVPGPT